MPIDDALIILKSTVGQMSFLKGNPVICIYQLFLILGLKDLSSYRFTFPFQFKQVFLQQKITSRKPSIRSESYFRGDLPRPKEESRELKKLPAFILSPDLYPICTTQDSKSVYNRAKWCKRNAHSGKGKSLRAVMALRFSYSRNVIIGLKCINGFQVISKSSFIFAWA